jgi:hypothetical protein
MAWPSPIDFNELIQSPQNVFEDATLRLCVPECNQFGLPKPRSGAFAVAYKLQSPQGNWAVKCFTRQPPGDSQQRYAAIGAYLSQQRFPYMVDFTYLHRGIRVRSDWYPVVKMQWAEGDPLHIYVQKNLGNSQILTNLALQWVQMIQGLQQAHIAHGDLQHGNVLVVNSALKLVDYDGMFVPTLAGKRSTELGQPNYQHPRRTEIDFGPYLDNFSGWVIYVSLVALSIYPNMWQTFRGGDDCLLFRRRDFEDPGRSGVLRALEHCQNQQLRDLVEFFKIALYSSPSDVPTFDNVAPLAGSLPAPMHAPSSPSWLQDHVVFKTAQPSPHQPTAPSTDPSWVLDFIAPATALPEFGSEMILVRALFWGCVIGALSAAFLGWIGLASLFAFGFAATMYACVQQYKSDPIVRSRAQSYAALRDVERELETARKAIEETEARTRELRSTEAMQVDKLTREIQNALADEKKQHDSADRGLRQAIASALQQRQRLDQQEAEELKQLQSTLGADVSSLSQQLAQSQQAEATERATALKAKQEQHIQNRLQSLVLTQRSIPGIGAYVINNLVASGIRTAADCIRLNHFKVPAVGQHRASAILAWRQSWENKAKLTMPAALNPLEDNAIKLKYAGSRNQLQSQLSNSQLSLATRQSSIQQKYGTARIPFDSQTAMEKAKHSSELHRILADSKSRQEALRDAILRAGQNANQAIAEIEKPVGAQRRAVQTAQWRVAKGRHESGRFRSITFGRYLRKVAIGR